jgi:hypothetical protein
MKLGVDCDSSGCNEAGVAVTGISGLVGRVGTAFKIVILSEQSLLSSDLRQLK